MTEDSTNGAKWAFLKKLFVLVVLCCFCFGCLWFVDQSIHPPLPQNGEEPRLYSNQCRQNLRTIYEHALKQAQDSIDLVMFEITDPQMIRCLNQSSLTLPVNIYTDHIEPYLWSHLPRAHLHPMKLQGLMHQKILTIDQKQVWIGSANMTNSSLVMHDNLIVGMWSPDIAHFLLCHPPYSPGYFSTTIGKQKAELWLLPDSKGSALSDITRMLRNAKHSIKIALFTFTHNQLCEELIAAKKRGVNVTVVIDLHSGLGASAKTLEKLQKETVQVLFSQGVQLLHHKFAWIDDETLVSGSANWTKAAFEKNSDCILALHQLTAMQKKFMVHLWNRIYQEAKPPSFESFPR